MQKNGERQAAPHAEMILFWLTFSGVFYIHTLSLLLQVQPAFTQEVLSP
jgi:hypothetical protein